MTERQVVCACEDVTLSDVRQAIAAGQTDMESLKRFTGLATGICQGRACLGQAAGLLAAATAEAASGAAAAMRPITARPPVTPVRLGHLAVAGALPELYPGPRAPALSPVAAAPRPPAALPPLPRQADVVIIGGGVMGLAIAYHLARLGSSRVVVLERDYLNAGASGRNGGGIRCQWSTEHNVALMQESLRACHSFAQELGINVWLRQGGYLFLARRPEHAAALERNVALQNRLGVSTRMVAPRACAEIVPGLTTHDVLAASFNPRDGVLFPWPFLWGYADGARRLGAHVATFTQATGIEVTAGQVCAVHTSRGSIACDVVVNAAAAWAQDIAAMVGQSLPSHAERHEITVTESLKPCLDPLVTDMDSGLYFSQSLRGEIVAGMGDPEQPPGVEMRSSLRFAIRIARALCARLPALAGVQQVRQWAGCYDVTPDKNPLLGWLDTPRGFFQVSGFVGHGFMMAPAVSRHVAAAIARGTGHVIFDSYRVSRFTDGSAAVPAETMIIG